MWKDKWPYLLAGLLVVALIFWFTACRGPASELSLHSPREQNEPTEQTGSVCSPMVTRITWFVFTV